MDIILALHEFFEASSEKEMKFMLHLFEAANKNAKEKEKTTPTKAAVGDDDKGKVKRKKKDTKESRPEPMSEAEKLSPHSSRP